MPERLSYEESYRSLQRQKWRGEGDIPPMPSHPPRYDDEVLGLEFFRTWLDGLKGADLTNMTLCRTYFGRSEINSVSFANSDLSESVANWNDFNLVDFTSADLSRVDFRGNNVAECGFINTNFTDADLRCCSFEQCNFSGALMARAKMTRATGETLVLSDSHSQRLEIDWHDTDGDEPDGG